MRKTNLDMEVVAFSARNSAAEGHYDQENMAFIFVFCLQRPSWAMQEI